MTEYAEKIVTIIAAIVAISGAFATFFSSINYDSFDMKLMPRNKSTIIGFRKILGVFLITVPLFIFAAYANASTLLMQSWFRSIVYIALTIVMAAYILSYIISAIEWIYLKLRNYNLLQKTQESLERLSPIYKLNLYIKDRLIFALLFLLLTVIADIHLTKTKAESLYSNTILSEILIISLLMSLIIFILLLPMYQRNNKEYVLLLRLRNEEDLLVELGEDNQLYLEYFLTESISVYSAQDHKYKIIKRFSSDSPVIFEVFKKIDS